MVKISKIFEQFKKINYILIFRYLVYAGIFCLFLLTLEQIFDMLGEKPDELCESGWKFDSNFNFPQGFAVSFIYYLRYYPYVCKMSTGALVASIYLISFIYIFFKSIGDAVLPVKRPWLRDSMEVLIALAVIHYDMAGYLFANDFFSLLPAFVLILFSETFYFWLMILFRRFVIKYTTPNPIVNGLFMIIILLSTILILLSVVSTFRLVQN